MLTKEQLDEHVSIARKIVPQGKFINKPQCQRWRHLVMANTKAPVVQQCAKPELEALAKSFIALEPLIGFHQFEMIFRSIIPE